MFEKDDKIRNNTKTESLERKGTNKSKITTNREPSRYYKTIFIVNRSSSNKRDTKVSPSNLESRQILDLL